MDAEGRSRIPGAVLRHPLASVILLSLLLRLALMPILTYEFDIYHWGVILQNIWSGNGLYDVAGYYYTPVWGYVMGVVSWLMDTAGGPALIGERFTELLPIEDLACRYHTATVTTIGFNVAMKAVLVVCDYLVAVMVYRFTEERTGDARRAVLAAALWLFCIPVVYMSAVQAQFDSLSALLIMATVVLVYRDRAFLAGAVFACSVLLKFFPFFSILVMVAYLWVRHRDDGLGPRRIAEAAAGAALMFAVLYLPQILDGTLLDSLSFVTGRVENSSPLVHAFTYLQMAVMVAGMLVTGLLMLRPGEDADTRFLSLTLVSLVFAVLTSNTPQYMIVFMPLLCMAVAEGRRYMRPYAVMTVGSLVMALSLNNFSLLLSLSESTSLVQPGRILSLMQGMESVTLLGATSVDILSALGGVIVFLGMLLLLMIYFRSPIARSMPRLGRLIDMLGGCGE